MENKLLINNPRFRVKGKNEYNRFRNFFYNFSKENYILEDKKCLCSINEGNNTNDQLVSFLDRYDIDFPTVICKNCGLIRAPKYFKEENVIDFYTNHYRRLLSHSNTFTDPKEFFNRQILEGEKRFNLVKKFLNIENDHKILDLGGGAGGNLINFKKYSKNLFLADYFEPYLDYANSQDIKVIKGGLKDIDFKPDVIILSHVIEHWDNFDSEIKNLIKIQKINKTLNYIEFPGIDSLKLGRRGGDFLEDIHYPHVYYFSSYVFENIMNRHGFEKKFIDSEIKSLFIYTGNKKPLINHYTQVKTDLFKAEFVRKKCILKSYIKKFIPEKILEIKRKRFRKKDIY